MWVPCATPPKPLIRKINKTAPLGKTLFQAFLVGTNRVPNSNEWCEKLRLPHHIVGSRQPGIVCEAVCNGRCQGHVVHRCFYKHFEHTPASAAREPRKTVGWLRSTGRSIPKIGLPAFASDLRRGANNTCRITSNVQVVPHYLRNISWAWPPTIPNSVAHEGKEPSNKHIMSCWFHNWS